MLKSFKNGLKSFRVRSCAGLRGALAVLALGASGLLSTAHADGFWKQVQDRGVLRCAYAFAPPYMMKDIKTGEYKGIYLDLCAKFADVLGVKVEYVNTDWDNIVAGLQAGNWDLSPALNRTPKRALSINFSTGVGYDGLNFSYLASNPKLQGISANPADLDRDDIRIGTVSGSAHDKALTDHFKKAKIVRFPEAGAVQMALMSSQIDLIGTEVIINTVFSKAHDGKVRLLEPKPPLIKQDIAYGLPSSVSWRDIEVLNIFLEEQKTLGYPDVLMAKYTQQMANP